MEFRKVFDTIPEKFDKWRPRYCDEAFTDVIEHSQLDSGKSALEIGPGTGQATEPILKTGCNYLAIELGEHLADDYISYLGTHCDHIVLKEPYKSKFYTGVRDAILEAGNKIILNDTIVLYLARKP
ncbi:MAG TPA: hypothetical protein DG942_02550 [Ruminococcaceae bacterium]|jgi:hypothetical protein|nr:hypothetical protein [Oscillospiraceae bacterium]